MNKYLRKIKRNSKALSPVVASIILIAVTVAVSVVVAAWMSGSVFGLMGTTENAKISYAQFVDDSTVIVTVQNNGANTITIKEQGNLDGQPTAITPLDADGDPIAVPTAEDFAVAKGTTANFQVAGAFIDGAQYSIQLMTAKGNALTFTATYTTPPAGLPTPAPT